MQIAGKRSTPQTRIQAGPLRLARPVVEVSVIVPTLNEAENLPRLVPLVADALSGRSFEIIIVDDNSQDQTANVCASLAEQYPLRLIVRREPRNGLSGAVIRGMRWAHGDYLVVMDADLQHPPEKIPQLLNKLQSNQADFALGSRYVAGGDTEEGWGLWRKANSRIATLLAKPVATGVRDPMSGFFALRSETFERARQLSATGYKIALELLCKCGIERAVEVPIHFGRREIGKSKLSARQQWRFLVHLSRLYQFKFPWRGLTIRLSSFAAIGASFAAMTNPSLMPFLAFWATVAMGYATRLNRPEIASWERPIADCEIDLFERRTAAQPVELAA